MLSEERARDVTGSRVVPILEGIPSGREDGGREREIAMRHHRREILKRVCRARISSVGHDGRAYQSFILLGSLDGERFPKRPWPVSPPVGHR